MYRILCYLSLVLILAACSAPQTTAQSVVDQFSAAGLDIGRTGLIPGEAGDASALPYREHMQFEITEVAPGGGKIFVCDRPANCDEIVQTIAEEAGSQWPYRYQNPEGTVVVLLPARLSAETADQFAEVVDNLQ